MLKKRIITAAIIVPLILASILFANPWVLVGLLVFTLGLGANEWVNLIPLKPFNYRLFYIGAVVVGAVLCDLTFHYWMFLSLALWGLIIVAIVTYPDSEKLWGKESLVMLAGIVLLPIAGFSVVGIYLTPLGPGLLIYILALVGFSDTGAYFVGKQFGKHKLIEKVSAGKTIEGAIGGLLFPMIVATIGAYIWSPKSLFIWFALALSTVVISMFGDLFISMLKRRVDLKDTGTLLPGHGGVLDRLDSILAAMPWFFTGYYYLCMDLTHV